MQLPARLALSALLLAGLLAGEAQAQISPFRTTRNERLDRSDVALMNQAAEKLYKAENVADGTTESWMNPKTGTSGTVTKQSSFPRTFQRMSLDCRRINYEIRPKQSAAPRNYTVNWCRLPNGTWKTL